MSSWELLLWHKLYEVEALGADREDLRSAQICAAIGNWSGQLKEGKHITPADYMLYLPKREESEEELCDAMQREVHRWAAQMEVPLPSQPAVEPVPSNI